MSAGERFESLWTDYLEGDLDEAGRAELRALLENNAALQHRAADAFQTHRLLGFVAQADTTDGFVAATMSKLPAGREQFVQRLMRRVQPAAETVRTTRAFWRRATVALAAAACVALMLGWWAMQPVRIVEVVAVSGVVRWQPESGAMRLVKLGEKLSAGRVETSDEDALLRLRFADGTQIEFSGATEARVSEGREKRVAIRSGLLTATVAPQPTGHPLRVLTPTAELEVLGTVFTLEAAEDESRLSVEHGRVRLRRLTDDQRAEVAADEVLVATLDASQQLAPARSGPLPRVWSAVFDPARERIAGRVLAADANGPLRVAAGPKIASDPMGDGPRVLHWRLYVAAPRGQSIAALAAHASLELRLRTTRAVPVRVTLTLRTGGVGLATAEIAADSPRDAEGWITARLPLQEFHPALAADARLKTVTLSTLAEDAALEVAELRVTE